MTVRTIVCDLDGVLIWHHPTDPSKDWRKLLLHNGALAIWEDFQRTPKWWDCLRDRTIDTRAQFREYLESNKCNITDHDAQTVIDIWLKHNLAACAPALRRFKEWRHQGLECCIATNQDGLRTPYIEKWLDQYGLGDLPRFISCELGSAKPDNTYFLTAQKILQHDPGELLLIDDSPENIAGARDAGWHAFLVDDSYKVTPSKWDKISPFPAI